MNNSSRLSIGLFLCFVVLACAVPQSQAGTLKWQDLSRNEQQVLNVFKGDWNSFSSKQQGLLKRWAAKTPAERQQIKKRYKEWHQLSSARKNVIVRQLRRYRQMPAAQRARLKVWHTWIKQLPKQEQKALRQQWSKMDHSERKQYMQALQRKYGSLKK